MLLGSNLLSNKFLFKLLKVLNSTLCLERERYAFGMGMYGKETEWHS